MSTKVRILDCSHYQFPDGKVFETHSRPTAPAPDGRFDSPDYGWHDVKAQWVSLAEIDVPCDWEI